MPKGSSQSCVICAAERRKPTAESARLGCERVKSVLERIPELPVTPKSPKILQEKESGARVGIFALQEGLEQPQLPSQANSVCASHILNKKTPQKPPKKTNPGMSSGHGFKYLSQVGWGRKTGQLIS